MKKITALLLIAFLLFTIPFQYTDVQAENNEQPNVTVKLVNYIKNTHELTVHFTGDYLLNDDYKIESGKTYTLKYENSKIIMFEGANRLHTLSEFVFVPSMYNEDHLIHINGRPYLGTMRFVPEGNYVRPINILPMEDYLKGVVPSEMPALWNLEAVKAQAIAARTYAASQGTKVMDDTINFQVYAGYEWHPNSTKAVNETSGQTLKYNGQYISAVFSASNGGKTESNANVWGVTASPYLPIKEDPYDSIDPWSFSISQTQIDIKKLDLTKPDTWWTATKEKETTIPNNIKLWLSTNGYPNSEIKIVSIPTLAFSNQLTSGGRVKTGDINVRFFVRNLTKKEYVKNADGTIKLHTLELKNTSAQRIRAMIGITFIRSYLVDSVTDANNVIVVKGRGYGHAVGLSQWGAKGMAEKGFKVNEILQFYYPGTTLTPFVKYEAPISNETQAPLSIKSAQAQYDEKHDQMIIRYSLNQNAAMTITVRDSSNKVVTTLIKDMNREAGELAQYWTVTKIKNDTYSFTIEAKSSRGEIASAKTQGKLNKISQAKSPAPAKSTETKPKQATPTKKPAATVAKKPTNNLAKAGTQVTGTVSVNLANIRKSATTKSKIVGRAKRNQKVSILGRTGKFYQVQVGKIKGYIHIDLLKINQKLSDKNNIGVIINGKMAKLDDKAVVRSKTLYVPLKGTSEGMKMKYQWNKKNNQITLKYAKTTVLMKVNSKSATVNKKKITVKNQPIKLKSKVFVSIKTLNQTTKANTYWDAKANIIWINK